MSGFRRRIICFIVQPPGLVPVPMRPCAPLHRLLAAHIALSLHLHGPADWSLDFMGGLATRQFRVAIRQGQ
jgi:hypothetical protein